MLLEILSEIFRTLQSVKYGVPARVQVFFSKLQLIDGRHQNQHIVILLQSDCLCFDSLAIF